MMRQLLCTSLFLTAVALSPMRAHSAAMVKIDGSSTVFPITEAVAEEFQAEQRGKVHVTVGISGTGGGFKKFCRGETDVQNASRPIQKSEMDACKTAGVKYYELPVAFDAMAIVVHPQNTWLTEITVDELKKMWEPAAQGKVTKWNQVNPKWPDLELKLFGAGSDSGTFDYFTEAITGKSKASRGDYTASEDDNMLVQGVAGTKGGLAYLPYAYYEENKSRLKLVAVVGGPKSPMKMKAVLPSRQNVENGSYYPLSRPIFIYVSESAAKRPEVMNFASFFLKNGAKLVEAVKYIPLPAKAYEMAEEHLKKGKVGTAFRGESEIGLKVEELLKREATL
ncbi:MAG: PstS family phosphate ABC transporter substrate-binding protein [Bdellovibrionaceae bacterium]|nr:PstS family phosphate ABC transporter substrate-binding protein [Pseudobdellovibrionaceae bacterium]